LIIIKTSIIFISIHPLCFLFVPKYFYFLNFDPIFLEIKDYKKFVLFLKACTDMEFCYFCFYILTKTEKQQFGFLGIVILVKKNIYKV
jgi:hypothetical protein